MEFILTSLESSRPDAAQGAVDHHDYHHHHDDDDDDDDDNTDVIISDRRRLQESFDAFAKALRLFVSDLHDTEEDDESFHRQHTSTPTLAAASSSSSQRKTTTSTTSSSSSLAMATWLYETCSRVPSPLPTLQLSLEVLSVANRTGNTGLQSHYHHNEDDDDDNNNDESSKMQSSLFELFGEGEQSIEAMFQVMEKLDSIRKDVSEMDLRSVAKSKEEAGNIAATTTAMSATAITSSTLRLEKQLQQLRAEAYEAADLATALRTDLNSTMTPSSSTDFASRGTHSVTRKSDKDAEKSYKRAIKQALNTLNKAREAGALTEYDDIYLKDQLSINTNNNSNGRNGASAMEQMMLRNEEAMLFNSQHARGLDGMTSQQIASMKLSLHPEGTRQYNDGSMRGLPPGTEREIKEGQYEKVIIPAHVLDKSMLRNRIDLDEVLGKDTDERAAFAGTRSLNPMQSTVFDAAYNTRENLLICAPTGAGKTNVAMLTVVSHLRDVGLIGAAYHEGDHYYDNGPVSAGKKIVYIAPMKALAQEVAEKFQSKLKQLGLVVKELTGDMQLSRAEADAAHVLVTTPEKWDVVTRKGGDGSLGATCGLLIIDEVHLLADERGAVIESVVARLHRWVESSQRQVRLVGLSATLPNYEDVATFLRVDKKKGLFFFGPEHRPVPLQQTFIGVTGTKNKFLVEKKMDDICYDVVSDSLRSGHQVMVFVHSRKGTGTTAKALGEHAAMEGELEQLFIVEENDARTKYIDRAEKSQNRELREHFRNGMGIHHAGMLRHDRKLTEQMFNDGAIKVLCCTATLAWGINLPAHTVVIKGTDVYMPEKGANVDLSILDVQQIFGRAGRPQFDTSGEATLITTYDAMQRYLNKLILATPIESNFIKQLADHLNAEVVGGTVTNIQEAIEWLRYTYLHVRMCKNPLAYGISAAQHESDPTLRQRSRELAIEASKLLDERQMVRFNPDSGNIAVTSLGRVASHFYIRNQSIATFNEMMAKKRSSPTDADLMHIMCCADEFENIRVRNEELEEIDRLKKEFCPLDCLAPVEEFSGKVNVLLQSYISKARVSSFTLISDTNYIASNAGRVARALFEMSLKKGNASAALKFLRFAKSLDHRIWWFQSPLRAFETDLKKNVFVALEDTRVISEKGYDTFERAVSLLDMEAKEVGQLCHCSKDGNLIQKFVRMLPRIDVSCSVHPITKGTLRFHIDLHPVFNWSARHHGGAEGFWLWIEDNANDRTYHNEYVLFSKRNFPESTNIEVIVPAFEPLPQQYFIRIVSDNWVGCESLIPVSFRHVIVDGLSSPTFFTNLFNLDPLPVGALADSRYEQLYSNKFEAFNPIQTQLFHVLYHTDSPVLLGAPTGSGKTIVAELALLRMKKQNPKSKCVYIAPLKSLARERLKEWRVRLGTPPLKWNVIELSGDTSHDSYTLNKADVLICTPEKWDLISRGWRGISNDFSSSSAHDGKRFVREVGLLIIDEIHLLGEERGAVLEAIVSRMRLISQNVQAEHQKSSSMSLVGRSRELTRIIGLSTALANPCDLADWIGITTQGRGASYRRGLYNFRPSVRPVPILCHVQGFPGRHYCPRMATMNKPCYAAIKDLSPSKPSLIFVASRRQTRLTALDLISYAAGEENPKSFLHCDDDYISAIAQSLSDKVLRHTITFGIGLHHAGLTSRDRETVETLYLDGHIQVLIATATLAWGVNLPAHLVIVKGTEFFDGKLARYVDYPVTDILQMTGRAGRPQFDREAVAVIMCEESKKPFLKRFLYEPFPVESCLGGHLCETINAEVSIGTINSLSDAIGYLEWTYYARRVKLNPTYYGAKSSNDEDQEEFFADIVNETMKKLQEQGCVQIIDTEGTECFIATTPLGQAASNFYLNYRTPKQMLMGVRSLRRIFAQHVQIVNHDLALQSSELQVGSAAVVNSVHSIQQFTAEHPMYTFATAQILYELSTTHEFDELPVRHNEEELNLELSRSIPWGHDLNKVSWWIDKPNRPGPNILDIMASPHTKCFLLLQAHIFKSKLPISDYINDMRSVVDQIPRLLAAMQFIAEDDTTSAGSFDTFSSYPLVRRIFSTGIMIGSNFSTPSNCPSVNIVNVHIDKRSDDGTSCRLHFDYIIEYNGFRVTSQDKSDSLGVSFILGTREGGYLLSHSSIYVVKKPSWKRPICMDFDSRIADTYTGQYPKSVVLRVLHEFVGGLDLELIILL